MSRLSRTKGANFELSLSKMFEAELGIERPLRNLSQYQVSGRADLMAGPFSVEAKRYASAAGGWFQADWWEQTKSSAIAENAIPLLVYKYDRIASKFVFPIYAVNTEWMHTSGDNWSTYPTDGNALMPMVCEQDVAMSIMREWIS